MSNAFELIPQFATAVWGGTKFAQLPGAPNDAPIAEVWLASNLEHRSTPVAAGIHAGKSLSEVWGKPFPLLLKLIDANRSLSVQVHPNDEQAKKCGHPCGKTEAWVVLEAQAGSRIYAGLKSEVDRAALKSGIQQGQIAELLHSFEPKVGDLIYLPAGTIHALGAGITVFEIQQSCDVTYRLYDWGRPREIHVEQALECAVFSGPIDACRDQAIVSPYFELHVHRGPVTIGGDGRTRVLISFGGPSRGCIDLPANRAVFVPSMDGECRLTPSSGAWIFECIIP